jgi:hypothetical protein
LPDDLPTPPQVAESGDPFTDLRIVELVARLERGRAQRIDDVTDRLNATYLDWHFSRRVVADALVALAAAWMADYRNVAGIVLDDGPYGPAVRIEDSPRVDPWFTMQANALLARCRASLSEFARRDRITGDG